MDLDSESMVSDDMVGDQTYDLEFARLVGLPEPLTAPPSPMSSSSSATSSSSKRPSPPLPPLPLVPSCLLCPRRTFLACLILASKFMQDRSYSNRAWAKLVGLPPREISRCERALGEALDWRLWVGKSATVAGRKPVARSKSDGELSFGVTSTRATDAAQLRRNATAPAGTFSMDAQAPFVGFFGDGLPQVIVEEPEQVPSVYVNTSQYARSLPGDATELLRDHDDLSPPMSTPTLFYSPMSSISSSSDDGDRTIQMSGFLDLPTPLPGTLAPFQGYDNLGSAPFAQDSLKGGVFLRGPRASSVMIMDSTPMPPMLNPAVTPYGGAMRLPSLYEALGDLTPAFANAKGGHGLSEVQDVSYSGNWRDVPPMN
ncbi:hypothetical protein EUX98_g2400 [Antrodiella citrinella]|uniref:Cyclin N-terminal domain-containing protein n=1 Tax=Antrodiella citrinella TaxID=2447956 RepID=A0A4V3XJ57_9APHY|nr:hypothetical protein EUX98_g2400 [Antrodiella citrinella]